MGPLNHWQEHFYLVTVKFIPDSVVAEKSAAAAQLFVQHTQVFATVSLNFNDIA